MYGFHVDLVWATVTHINPMQTTVCDSIVFCYGNATYFLKLHISPIGDGIVWTHSNSMQFLSPFYGNATYFVKFHISPIGYDMVWTHSNSKQFSALSMGMLRIS